MELDLFQKDLADELSGETGLNREVQSQCQINAINDLQAVRCFLNEFQESKATYRTYKKEIERFLLWSIIELKKPLSSINRDDLEAYFAFTKDPKPKDRWCAPKGSKKRRRGTKDWRPFVGPLSMSAQKTTRAVLKSLFGYLVDARYLVANPVSLIRRKAKFLGEENEWRVQERILDDEEWAAMLKTLAALPDMDAHDKDHKERLLFLVSLLYLLGLRIHEVETHTWSAFRKLNDHWWFFVRGKGGKLGKIPVNQHLLRAAARFRRHLGLAEEPENDDMRPLIPSWTSARPLSSRQMSSMLKKLAKRTAEKHFYEDVTRQKKLAQFSPHWLRHLSASMQDRAGISFKHIKENLRHENEQTTRIYVHASDEERHEDMDKLRLFDLDHSN